MDFIILDDNEMLERVDSMDEAIEYVKECRLEDIKEHDVEDHKYLIVEQKPRANAAAKARVNVQRGIVWKAFAFVWSIITCILGALWWIVWFCTKLVAKILAYCILSFFNLILLCIQGCIILILLIVTIKSNVMD